MSAQTREALGNRIRELRKTNHLTQQTLALMVNVERSYLTRLEHGMRNPSIDCIEKIASGLGVTLSELFEGIGPGTDADAPGQEHRADADASETAMRRYAVVKLPNDDHQRR